MVRILTLSLFLYSCVGTDVLEVELVPARVEITDYPISIREGETFQLGAVYFDSVGAPTNQTNFTWISSDPTILSVQENGLIEALSMGTVEIADILGQAEDRVMIEVNEETVTASSERTGSLEGRGGYDISGNFRIYEEDGTVILEFTDAVIDNTAPGAYYYLSNQSNSVNGGLNLGPAPSGDSIYELPDDVSINTYDVVVVWCEPFAVTLGFGEFDN
jgi:hypothetical protein